MLHVTLGCVLAASMNKSQDFGVSSFTDDAASLPHPSPRDVSFPAVQDSPPHTADDACPECVKLQCQLEEVHASNDMLRSGTVLVLSTLMVPVMLCSDVCRDPLCECRA